MARAAAAVLGLLPAASRASFSMRPFSHYESSDPAPGSLPGTRRYHHHERHLLEDGSDVELGWKVDADPGSVMPLDLHHGGGARVLHCSPSQLVLQVPEHHARDAHAWQHVTASPHVHGCSHLADRDLYHRVVKVDDVQPIADHPDRHHTVRLTTKELKAANDVFPNCEVFFSFNPSGSQAPRPTPPVATAPAAPRRLGGLGGTAGMRYNKPKVSANSNFQPAEHHVESILNLQLPHQMSRINYNWDYDMNTTKNPQFKYIFPGGVGLMRLYHPYLIANIGLRVNFSSEMKDIRKPPHVFIRSEINGTANLNADIATMLNFTKQKAAGVLNGVVKKMLPDLNISSPLEHMFISPLKLNLGGTPLTIQPTFNTKLKAYHIGLMEGSLRVGLATQLEISGTMTFDTADGLDTNIVAKALNVKFTPPNWMIFTEAFELGMMLEPELCMKGGFAAMEDMAMCLSLRPYFNVSVKQEGADGSALYGAGAAGDIEGSTYLAVYPYRATGLPAGKDYSIVIRANNKTVNTTLQMSTGVAEFFDDVDKFSFGEMTEAQLIGSPIQVQILENGVAPSKGQGTAYCTSLVNGMCNPNPVVVTSNVDGQDVQVELAVVLSSSPTNFLKSQTKSISLRFPTVTASGDVAKKLEAPGALKGAALRLTRNGRSYDVPLEAKINGTTSLLEGNVIYELGPSFLGLWKYPAASSTGDGSILTPKIELIIGGETIGSGNMPPIAWDTSSAVSSYDEMTKQARQSLKAIPVMIPISNSDHQIVGTVQVEIDVLPPSKSAFWVSPGMASFRKVGQEATFAWAVHGGEENMEYDFTLEALEVSETGALTKTGWQANVSTECSVNKTAAAEQVLRYTGGVTPCLFSYKIEIPASLSGHHVVMVAGWSDAGARYHEMLSAPIEFGDTDVPGGRRLGDAGKWGVQELGDGGGAGDYGATVTQNLKNLHKKACDAKPLTYNLGAGMTFIERMQNIMMPMSMPMLGDDSSPDWQSEPISVWKLGKGNESGGEGKDLKELLPKSVCAGGVCNGMLPGCHKTQVNPIQIKQIVFKLDRNFKWNANRSGKKGGLQVSPKMRNAIAYALALFPSAVQVANRQSTGTSGGSATSGGGGSTGGGSTSGAAALRETLEGVMGWRQAHRRLAAGEAVFEPEEPELEEDVGPFDEFTVDILEPMHYTLTQDYLQTLIDRGTLRLQDGREDELGPIGIRHFRLIGAGEEGPPPRSEAKPPALVGAAERLPERSLAPFPGHQGSLPMLVGVMTLAAAACVAGAAVTLSLRRQGCRVRYQALRASFQDTHNFS